MNKPTVLAFLVAAVLVVRAAWSSAGPTDQSNGRNYDHLIQTGASNYALTSSHLLQRHNANWNTVSVNGNDVLFVSSECHYSIKQYDSLSETDRAALANAKASLESNGLNNNNLLPDEQLQGFDCAYELESGALLGASSFGGLRLTYSRGQRGASITQFGQGRFSAGHGHFAGDLVRLFVDQQVASFVYRDGRVRMKPLACLQPAEVRLVGRMRAEANSFGALEAR